MSASRNISFNSLNNPVTKWINLVWWLHAQRRSPVKQFISHAGFLFQRFYLDLVNAIPYEILLSP